MKTILFLVFLFYSGIVSSQDTIVVIPIYPFSESGNRPITRSLKYGQRVKFNIYNVNTLKYDADLKSEKLNFDFDIPSIITESITQAPLPDSKKGMDFSGISEIATDQDKFLQELRNFKKLYDITQQRAKLSSLLNDLLENVTLIENIDELKLRLGSYYNAIYTDISEQDEAIQDVSRQIEALENSYSVLKNIYKDIAKNQKSIPIDLSGIYTKDINNSIIIKDLKINQNGETLFTKEFEAIEKVMTIINDPVKREELINKSFEGIDLHFQIQHSEFKAYTDSEEANADEITFIIKLRDRKGEPVKEFPPYSFRTKGGIKFNFSTGYLLSFRGDDNYSLYKDEEGKNQGIIRGNNDDLTHALGFLSHVYFRGSSDVQPAFSAGISFQENANIGFYSGLSVLFQEKNRFVLTSGLAFTKLKKLNTANLYQIDNGFRSFISENDNEIKYDEVYKPSLFVGITFNLNEKKVENKEIDVTSN